MKKHIAFCTSEGHPRSWMILKKENKIMTLYIVIGYKNKEKDLMKNKNYN